MAKPREIFENEHRLWGHDFVTFASLRRILDPIYDALERLMADASELATAQAAEATELATVTTDLATLSTDTANALKALQEKVEQGGSITAQELEAAVTNSNNVAKGLTDLDTAIKSEDATVNPPAPVTAETSPAPAV